MKIALGSDHGGYELKEYVKNELLSQTHYKTLLEKVTLTYDAATESWDIDVSQAVAAFEEMFAADVLNTTLMMREFSEIIRTYTDLGDEIIAAFNLLGDEYGDIFERELFKFGKSIGTDGNDIIKDDDFKKTNYELKSCYCPNCGHVEFFVDLNNPEKNKND